MHPRPAGGGRALSRGEGEALHATLEAALGQPVRLRGELGGFAHIVRLELADGTEAVAKWQPQGGLGAEGRSLTYLAERTDLPVPDVLCASDSLLVMEHVRQDGGRSGEVEEDAAAHLAALHDHGAEAYGFDFDTPIGPLVQPNGWMEGWFDFYRERRLLPFARQAEETGNLSPESRRRVERVAGRLEALLEPPVGPSLVHGDVWSGNVLAEGGRVAAFIDPALHFAAPEVELAFVTLFGTFGRRFFAAYGERRRIAPDFFEIARPLYNLYPLLVHTILFSGSYAGRVEAIARRFS